MNACVRLFLSGLAVAGLAACAKSPESIQPAYVSPVTYDGLSCPQLGEKQGRLATALATASNQQSQARSNDIAGILLLGLPVASLSGENIAPQIALYKGQQEAVRQVTLRKSCLS